MRRFTTWLIASLVFGTIAYVVIAQDSESLRIDLEKKITSELYHDLGKLLPDGQFALFVDLAMGENEKMVLSEEEKTGTRLPETPPPPANVEQLPGFLKPEPPPPAVAPGTQLREKYLIHKITTIEAINVTLIVHQEVPAELKDLASAVIKNKISHSYRGKGDFTLKEATFDLNGAAPNEESPFVPAEHFNLEKFFAKPLNQPLVVALLLAFIPIIMYLLLHRRLDPKLREQARSGAEKSGGEGSDGKSERSKEPTSSAEEHMQANLKIIDTFLEQLSRHPLVCRKFLQKSLPSERQAIFANLHTAATKEVFAKLFGEDINAIEQSIKNAHSKYHRSDLAKLIASLNQYINVQSIFEQRKFGYLHFISADELLQVTKTLTLEERALLIPQLSGEQCQHLLGKISPEERATLIDTLLSSSPHEGEREVTLDRKLRKAFTANVEEVFSGSAKVFSPVEFVLENDPDISTTVDILKQRPEFAKNSDLAKYLMSIDDLLISEAEKLKELFNRCENEDIAQALADRNPETIKQVMGLLSSVRRQLVDNLLQQQQAGKEKILAAQSKLLRTYRNIQKG